VPKKQTARKTNKIAQKAMAHGRANTHGGRAPGWTRTVGRTVVLLVVRTFCLQEMVVRHYGKAVHLLQLPWDSI